MDEIFIRLTLNSSWFTRNPKNYWDRNLICTNPWHPLFNAQGEALSSMPMWINLPNLPLEFWSDSGFRAIGDVLGNFIALD
jgi:hypothetical protein